MSTNSSFVKKLLRNQHEIFDALINKEKTSLLGLQLFGLSALGLFLYGFLVTTIYPDTMLWVVQGAKLLMLLYGSIAVCVPIFYVLLIIKGSEKSFLEMLFLMMGSLATASVILLSLLPVAWFFAFSLENPAILSVMHIFFIGLSVVFGFVFLIKGTYYIQNKKSGEKKKPKIGAALGVFTFLLLLVSIQMGKNISPLFRMTDGFSKIEFSEKMSTEEALSFLKKHELDQICQDGNDGCEINEYQNEASYKMDDPCYGYGAGHCPDHLLEKSKERDLENDKKKDEKKIDHLFVSIPLSKLEHKWKAGLEKEKNIKSINFVSKKEIIESDQYLSY